MGLDKSNQTRKAANRSEALAHLQAHVAYPPDNPLKCSIFLKKIRREWGNRRLWRALTSGTHMLARSFFFVFEQRGAICCDHVILWL